MNPTGKHRDLTGHRVGKLTAIECIGVRSRFRLWLCKCDCGQFTEVQVGNWGKTKQCRKCAPTPVPRTHGLSQTPEYSTWKDMIGRCTNPKFRNYKGYGGRGITVCDRWFSFENFYADMGLRPEGMTLDRRDNDLGYSPENCRWATRATQARNTRRTISITHNGVTKNAADWARDLNVNYSSIRRHFLVTGNLYTGASK